jgi:anti-sigma factor RsiW
MNCGKIEELLALYVEGDLDGHEVEQVEAHLEACPACRSFAEGMRASQAALKALGREEIDPAVFVRVRSRVMERVVRPRGLPYWAWLATAAACVLLVIALYPRGVKPQPPSSQVVKWPSGQVAAQTPEPPKAVVQAPRPGRKTQARMPVPPPLVIKIITDDPDVVIYWISG